MSDPSLPAANGAPGAAGAWLDASDALLRGVGHALNNRVAALSALVQVLVTTGEGGPLHDALGEETRRLQRAVELIRLLPRRWDSPPEPLLVADAVRDALEILPLHPDLPVLRYDWVPETDLPPVLVEPTLFTHALCLVGQAAAEVAARAGAAAVSFRGSATDAEVTVAVVAGEAAAAEGAGQDDAGATGDPARAAPLMELAGGELRVVERSGRRLRVELRLPTLAEARRRGR